MELRHLRYFVAVANELNFTRAAQSLRVAQPALSRQIRQLEDELGVRLLDRSPQGAQLSKAGRAFLAEAEALLRQTEQAIRATRGIGGRGAEFNLGYVWGLFHSFVPAVLVQFRQSVPETAVHLFDLPAPEQAQALVESRLDAGFIGFAEEADAAGLQKTRVGTCEFVAALPKGHRATRHSRVELRALAEDFFLGISEETYPGASRHVMTACARAGFRPKILQMVERGYTILGLVASGCGVALLPASLQALPHSGVVFRRLAEIEIADLYVAWRSGRESDRLRRLLDAIKQTPSHPRVIKARG